METGAISTHPSLASAAAALQKSPREERTEAIDSANEERTEANTSSHPPESRPELSESGLKLSASFLSHTSKTTESTIENNAQAQQAINALSIAIQKSPDQAGAAQNNLTSNVVKSLLG